MFTQDAINKGILTEVEPHKFVTEASTLGWRAGHFPDQVNATIGNGQFFYPVKYEVNDGDLLWVLYRQNFGIVTVKVFND